MRKHIVRIDAAKTHFDARQTSMKTGLILFIILLALFLLFGPVEVLAQETSYITVKGNDANK
jgi:hypothetical protein